ncbi:MAG: hypothetical protein M3H12_05145 [Chromatiales bacterium]|nr:hypothetical protein [Gammaproteobacteria bacterium]
MNNYLLKKGLFVLPTPAGAYYCVSTPDPTIARIMLRAMMNGESSHRLAMETLTSWSHADEEETIETLLKSQTMGWIEGFEVRQPAPEGILEDLLPHLLPKLSGSGKAILADEQGFSICSLGFSTDTAINLSAISADIASMHERRRNILHDKLEFWTSAWALVDAAGNSQVGFWPIYIGKHRFVLIIGGVPHLNQPGLTQLIWALNKRYGSLGG